MKNRIFAILMSLSLFGCEGGSSSSNGDSRTLPVDAVFLTSSPDTDDVGELQRFDLTGSATMDSETVQLTGVECHPNDNYRNMPESVTVGESGVNGSVSCSDGTEISGSYLVERSSRNAAWAAVRLYSTTSFSGEPDFFEDDFWHISQDGRVNALEIVAGDSDISLELGS